jgi:hypothetical protein
MNTTNNIFTNVQNRSISIFAELRAMVPEHGPLSYELALGVARQQAHRLRQLLDITTPELPTVQLTGLPRVKIVYRRGFPSSGAAQWSQGRWLIFLNATDPRERQRFSISHELFHIINYWHGSQLHPGDGRVSARTQAERLADYFAGCLLMPERDVRRLARQDQASDTLAQRFQVSTRAMEVRLSQLGLSEPQPRCSTPTHLEVRREVTA